MKQYLKVAFMILAYLIILTPFIGFIYFTIYILGSPTPDLFGYGVGPIETFLTLGFIVLLFKTTEKTIEFITSLFDKIFNFFFKEKLSERLGIEKDGVDVV